MRAETTAFYAAILLTALSLLYLEVFSVRLLAIVLNDSVIYYVISLAMLGIGSAGALATLTKPIAGRRVAAMRVSWLALAASGAILVLFLGIRLFTDAANDALDVALSEGTTAVEWQIPAAYLRVHVRQVMVGTLLLGTLMFIPYLLLGLVLAILFRAADPRAIPRMYAMDLVGACLGAVLAIAALDYWDFTSSAMVAIASPLLAAGSLAAAAARPRMLFGLVGASVVGLALIAFTPIRGKLEPQPHVPSMGRTPFMYQGYEARELWHTWTSYGRVAAVELRSPSDPFPRTVMVHGNGEGHARVYPYDGDPRRQPKPIRIRHAVRLALAACNPERVLVLFAGAGADMVLIDRYTGGDSMITGVELIPEVFTWPARQEPFGLERFFAKPNVRMIGAEAREFLARDRDQYDCILLSWSGASRGYITGVSASAPAYLLTEEGQAEILSHLAPGGQFTLLAGNRAGMMAHLSQLLRAQGRTVEDAFVLASIRPPESEEDAILPTEGNTQFLMVKPDGFSQQDVARVDQIVSDEGLHLIYSPDLVSENGNAVAGILRSREPFAFINALINPLGSAISPVVDDRPFADDSFPVGAYLTSDFWLGRESGIFRIRDSNVWRLKRYHVLAVAAIASASVLLILVPLLVSYRNDAIQPASGVANHIAFFGCLGAGFMFIEMGLIQKLRLLVGHPGHTIAIVLASVILFTGVGSFSSERLFGRGVLTFRRAALLAALTTAGTLALLETYMPALVGLARPIKLMLAFGIPAVPAFFMGQLFPQGLAALSRSERLVPLSMGVNAMTGTIAAGLGVVFAPIIGFRGVIILGCVIYVIVAGLPHGVRMRSDASQTSPR